MPEERRKNHHPMLGRQSWNKGTKGIVKSWNKGQRGIYSNKTLNKMSRSKRFREYIVIDPNGKTYVIDSLSRFCKENTLNKGAMCAVARGEWKSYKGWKVTIL